MSALLRRGEFDIIKKDRGKGGLNVKKIIALILGMVGVCLCFVACADIGVTPVAYTRFAGEGEQYFYYSSDVYGLEHGQIEVYKDEASFNDTYPIADLSFRFRRCLGADTLDDYQYTLVDLSNKKVYLSVSIYKGSEIYSADKKIYLNGVALTPTSTWDSDILSVLTFENITSFVRTNPNGKMDKTKVNTIEYK